MQESGGLAPVAALDGYVNRIGPCADKNICKVNQDCHHLSERKLERNIDERNTNLNEVPVVCFETPSFNKKEPCMRHHLLIHSTNVSWIPPV